MYDPIYLLKDMNDSQRMMFQSEYSRVVKNRNTALILTLFLGGLGAQRYYLGQIALGVVSTLFCWTFIPLIISIIDLFLIRGRVDHYNEKKAHEIAGKLRSFTAA
ncbi:TM2 domain-containing protein [Dehalobacter sp. DCM]|uniref:TM2 domain-containing protein n=1 Tax=Dehalobacter sp. DCM TaxID=2907827 RepID=UPI0030816830|nr:TM2 domain-containing protein [Dehalobacter sp. DCM]